ncbi:MAG: VOC family protein [Desulfoprunum sp.]
MARRGWIFQQHSSTRGGVISPVNREACHDTGNPGGVSVPLTPAFVFKDARKAIEFYKKAFGAEERFVMPGPAGKGIMHAEIRIGSSPMMLGEENPQCSCRSAETKGGSPISFYVYVDNVDEAFRTAVAAEVEVEMPVDDMFWGDRMGTVRDPFGYSWSLASHTRDLTMAEIEEGAKAAFAKMAEA